MVKKSPVPDKVITLEQEAGALVPRGSQACDTLPHKLPATLILGIKKRPVLLELGVFSKRRINAWSTADAYALYADRLSYAQPHGRRG